MKTLLTLSLLLASFAAHAADVDQADDHRDNFDGYFKLTRGVYGMCDEVTRVFTQGSDNGGSLFVGGYFFPAINGGTQRTVSEVDVDTIKTTLRNNDILSVEHRVSKLADLNMTTIMEAKLTNRGNTLTFRLQNKGNVDSLTLCVYKRTKDPADTNF